jgi:hypothetical protein
MSRPLHIRASAVNGDYRVSKRHPALLPQCPHSSPRALIPRIIVIFSFPSPSRMHGHTRPAMYYSWPTVVAAYDTVTRHDGSSPASRHTQRSSNPVGTVPMLAACFPRFIIQSGRSPPARSQRAPVGLCLIRTAGTRCPSETRSLQRLLTLLELRILQPHACFPVIYISQLLGS